MNTPRSDRPLVEEIAAGTAATLSDPTRTTPFADLARTAPFQTALDTFRDRSVLLAANAQFPTAQALIALDGIARRIVLCPTDVRPEHLPTVAEIAEADLVLSDGARAGIHELPRTQIMLAGQHPASRPDVRLATEWVLLTSGTTGAPKLVRHALASLGGSLPRDKAQGAEIVWSTCYDIRRYGGLQMFLRAVLGGSSFVLSDPEEPFEFFIARLIRRGVTHLSGTPSHWRKILMSPAAKGFGPRYVRLSGEIADQGVLDALRAAFPDAVIEHAYASTEAGVGFTVSDGRAGFPDNVLGRRADGSEIKIEDGSLRIRSPGLSGGYLGGETLVGPDGFVDTGDLVEKRNGRWLFLGRKGGIINVGGQKLAPEEVEAVLNAHPAVRMSLVKAKKNPLTGAVVVAEVVLREGEAGAEMEARLREACRARLEPHKVPALIRFVPSLAVGPGGKLVRHG